MHGYIIMLKGQWLFYYNLSVSGTTKSFRFAIGMSKRMDGWTWCNVVWALDYFILICQFEKLCKIYVRHNYVDTDGCTTMMNCHWIP